MDINKDPRAEQRPEAGTMLLRDQARHYAEEVYIPLDSDGRVLAKSPDYYRRALENAFMDGAIKAFENYIEELKSK